MHSHVSCKRTFVWPVDQTVLLCVDQVVVHHFEKVEAKRRGVEEVEKVKDQTTTNANET